uniref:U6 snRNA-associated Sm-like protein LSm1 n=1 Tax=Kwoniella dejecticola CBS 10117 TaxID=1296121 RepID=A0A1A5ZWT2_9TREE|nr:U6 snRNA-associated Sm-like protein LSm1 [Kwoniella dejecticola CBS 10117]OBR82265.1 U6 snRNA-associated Sm-like protein LSm1 [Kwoniella dejecticola CBS 10117]
MKSEWTSDGELGLGLGLGLELGLRLRLEIDADLHPHYNRKSIGSTSRRSYDQFANFLLESCIERIHHKFDYADRDIGVLLVRGENVVALGEIDLIAEDMVPLKEVAWAQVEEQINAENKRRERDHAVKDKVLASIGFVNEGREGDAY